jgi:putative oxidoreductase
MFIRTVARPLLASWFVYAAVDAILDPGRHAAKSAPLVEPYLREAGVTLTVPQLARIHGALTLVAATALAFSRTPRTAGLALAGLATVTVATGEPFWREDDEDARAASRESFVKNISLLGGALIAATAGGSGTQRRREKARAKRRIAKTGVIHTAGSKKPRR